MKEEVPELRAGTELGGNGTRDVSVIQRQRLETDKVAESWRDCTGEASDGCSEGGEVGEQTQLVWDFAGEVRVPANAKLLEGEQRAQLGRDGAIEEVVLEAEHLEGGDVGEVGWYLAGEAVGVEEEELEGGEGAELGWE